MTPITKSMAEAQPSVLDHFPYPSYRPYQKETILKIADAFEHGKRFAVLEVPTGGGKSGIAITLAKHFGRSHIVTAQKALQSQYMNDFGDMLVDLKGRNAYECWLLNKDKKPGKEKAYCDKGLCKQMGESKLPDCFDEEMQDAPDIGLDWILCPYFRRLRETQLAGHTLFNFSSFLFQANYAKQFGKRKLLIVDEAHNVESQIMSFVEISLSDRDFRDDGIRFPSHETPEEYKRYFDGIGLSDRIKKKITQAKHSNDTDAVEKWNNVQKRLDAFVKEMEPACAGTCLRRDRDRQAADRRTKFVAAWKDHRTRYQTYRTVSLKPLYVKDYAPELLFAYGTKVLLMSATILDHRVFCENLGIDLDEVEFVRAPSTFPFENRPIRLRYAGSMSFRNRQETLPLLVRKIEKALDLHAEDRGIIHTHAFSIAHYIRDNIAEPYRKRLLFQEDFANKEALLAMHAKRNGGVIVAPAMHEGIDLKDDLSRFQIICKVPYPNANADKQLKLRMQENWHYYLWLTALKLVQGYGRSIRSETDYAQTYILDSDFDKFLKMARKMLPAWFLAAILWQ